MFARPAFPSPATHFAVPLELFWTPPTQQPSSPDCSSCGNYADQTALDTATIDALLLFRETSKTAPRGGMSEAERRAKHCEVQRRFAKRKQIEFKQIKKQAAALELQYNFLQSAKEIQTLTEERTSLLLKYKMCDINVDGSATETPPQPRDLRPAPTAAPLFDFDLTVQKEEWRTSDAT